ncbi:hypothetical protein [Iningainema tapete]|uniref:Uncharacterized protein n=1 Tax=Iningainema tapete BLCC-T55 TaxID=2748662 RepID=A0A8J6XDJ5_9CYAN|nr:hypothetical protein [Iningainema tapete]MBD2773334.1 hypothetical protein [Iningainema tapete BLCC-T55]
MGDSIDMRLMGTEEDLNKWAWFLGECEKRQLITILEKSKPYPNRGDSKFVRQYIKIKLNAENNPA